MLFNKYNLLILFSSPILILFALRIYDNYKRRRISIRAASLLGIFCGILITGIFFNKYFFDQILKSKLSDSTPLSLYDMIQIVAIIFLIYVVFRQTFKIEELKNKITKINEEIALNKNINK